jgi:hypothetical protein
MDNIGKLEFYPKPHRSGYDTYRFFYMPTPTGSTWAIAVDHEVADYIITIYTILISFIFLIGWKIITYLAAAIFITDNSPNRYVGLVSFLNSGEPMAAISNMIAYCWRIRRYGRLWDGMILLLFSISMAIGGTVTGNDLYFI